MVVKIRTHIVNIVKGLYEVICTFEPHPDAEALLEATERTPLPLGFVYFTLLVLRACVPLVVLHCSLEEALKKEDTLEAAEDCFLLLFDCYELYFTLDIKKGTIYVSASG